MKTSLLIVDDEPKVRSGLRKLVAQRSDDWQILEPCADGRTALEALRSKQVDVMLTDIRMPGVDGLKLTEEAHKVSPATVVVIISGYQEFEYAQRAIRYGVVGFVVKPVDESELLGVLTRARAEARRRRKVHSDQLAAMDGYAIKEALFAALVASRGDGDAAQRFAAVMEIGREWYLLLHVYVPERGGVDGALFCRSTAFAADSERERVRQSVSSLRGHRRTALFLRDNAIVAFVFGATVDAAMGHARELSRLIGAIKSAPDAPSPMVGLSRPHVGAEQIWTACGEASAAADAHFYADARAHRDPASCAGRHPAADESPWHRSEMLQEKLVACLGAGDPEATAVHSREFLEDQFRAKAPLPVLEEHMRVLVALIKERIDPSLLTVEAVAALVDPLVDVDRYWSFDAFAADLSARLDQLAARVMTVITRRVGRAVQLALEYIEQNFSRDLPLDEVARHVCLSASYFSSNFKKETGRSFVEYVTEFRLEKAKALLAGTNLRMLEVAYNVGFRDPKYFARTFRESVGLTPTRYRNCALTAEPRRPAADR